MGHNSEVPIMSDEPSDVDPVSDVDVRISPGPVDDPSFQELVDERARNDAAVTEAELELLAQVNQLQEDLALADAERELGDRAGVASGPTSTPAADLNRAVDLLFRFLATHGTTIVFDLATGRLADPKWARTWREFVAAEGRAA
jgi:hypothetical protein